jgi:hypothetical protein
MRRHFDHDPVYGMDEVFHFDEGTGDVSIESRADVEPILDNNKRLQNDGTNGFTPSRDMKRIASIPNVIIEMWRNQLGVDLFNKDHEPAIKRLLNDPDWQYLRTSHGRF